MLPVLPSALSLAVRSVAAERGLHAPLPAHVPPLARLISHEYSLLPLLHVGVLFRYLASDLTCCVLHCWCSLFRLLSVPLCAVIVLLLLTVRWLRRGCSPFWVPSAVLLPPELQLHRPLLGWCRFPLPALPRPCKCTVSVLPLVVYRLTRLSCSRCASSSSRALFGDLLGLGDLLRLFWWHPAFSLDSSS